MNSMETEPMNSISVFTHTEIMKMEHIFNQTEDQSLSKEFYQNLATNFSCQPSRVGKLEITWEQVEGWFQAKEKEFQAKHTSSNGAFDWAIESCVDLSALTMIMNEPEDPCVTDLSELTFEARSSKDGAWYDVAFFLSYRIASSGDLEMRVRFAGFGREEDEWVRVRKRIRDRSIPLEDSECQKVKVGDLIMCFKEREDEAVYFDALVMDIRRSLHSLTGCTCVFVVQFFHDNTKEEVPLKRLCCRPVNYTSSALVCTSQDATFHGDI